MKPIFTMIVLAAALSAGSAAQAADAVGVTVTGAITGTTCGIRSDRLAFNLGNVERSSLPSSGSTSPLVTESLISSGCDATSVKITAAGTASPISSNLFAAEGGSFGVGIELFVGDTGTIATRLVPNNTTGVSVSPVANGGDYKFSARYHRVGSVLTRGDATASITLTLDYI